MLQFTKCSLRPNHNVKHLHYLYSNNRNLFLIQYTVWYHIVEAIYNIDIGNMKQLK